MDIPVQPRMINQNLQATADEKNNEDQIDVVSDANPERKTLWLFLAEELSALWDGRKAHRQPLHVGCKDRQQDGQGYHDECRTLNAHLLSLSLTVLPQQKPAA
jgi:hypothetical protein